MDKMKKTKDGFYVIEDDVEQTWDRLVNYAKMVGLDCIPRNYRPKNFICECAPRIIKTIISPPCTIVFWDDNTKTVVKCVEGDTYNEEVGVALCILKKYIGNNYYTQIKDVVADAYRPQKNKNS